MLTFEQTGLHNICCSMPNVAGPRQWLVLLSRPTSCKHTLIEDAGLVSVLDPLVALLKAPSSQLDEVGNDDFTAPAQFKLNPQSHYI